MGGLLIWELMSLAFCTMGDIQRDKGTFTINRLGGMFV